MGVLSDNSAVDVGELAQWLVSETYEWGVSHPALAAAIFVGAGSVREVARRALVAHLWQRAREDSDFIRRVQRIAVQVLRDRTGIVLDEDNPFSVPSLTGGVSRRIGIPLSDITDKDAVMRDVVAYGVGRLAELTGFQLDPNAPFTSASITAAVSAKTGVPLVDIFDVEQTRADLIEYAGSYIAQDAINYTPSEATEEALAGIASKVTVFVREKGTEKGGERYEQRIPKPSEARSMLLFAMQQRVRNYRQRGHISSKTARRLAQWREASARYRARKKASAHGWGVD